MAQQTIFHTLGHIMLPIVALLFLITGISATSATPSPTSFGENSGNASSTQQTGPAMITVPIMGDASSQYNIVLSDHANNTVEVSLDFMQPHLWFINGESILQCSAIDPYLSSYNYTNYPSSLTVSGETYNADECYLYGAYTLMTTTTIVSDSSTRTVTQTASVPTTSSLNITYPYDYYGSGYFVESNFSLARVEGGSVKNGSLPLDGLSYLLADDSNAYQGGFGVAGPSRQGGVFDSLKSSDLIYGNGWSAFFFNSNNSEGSGGYLLLGSVDQKLYSGDFYAFPQIPHEGWGDTDAILPILALDSVELENLETTEMASLYEDDPIGVVLDPTLLYSYLPRDVVINLALQTNAYYTSFSDTWIVNCSAVDDIDAAVNFNFGPLKVQVPLSSIVQPSNYLNLTYADGQEACIFNVRPSETLGYNAFGVTFLHNLYVAMDNEGGQVALANANADLKSQSPSSASQTSQNSSTVGYIRSDYIPFATNATVASDLTFTFGAQNYSAVNTDPGLMTNVFVSSGHVYFSSQRASRRSASGSASAADARSTSGGAGSLHTIMGRSSNSVLYLVLLLGGAMGIILM